MDCQTNVLQLEVPWCPKKYIHSDLVHFFLVDWFFPNIHLARLLFCPNDGVRYSGSPLFLFDVCSVSGQNKIGIYITPLVLIQPIDVEQNAVNNIWLLKLQPAVKVQNWQKSNFHQIE